MDISSRNESYTNLSSIYQPLRLLKNNSVVLTLFPVGVSVRTLTRHVWISDGDPNLMNLSILMLVIWLESMFSH
jgi:hypothetical protein